MAVVKRGPVERNSDGTARTRTQNAASVATRAVVLARKARAQGCTNTVTDLALMEAATVLEVTHFSMTTARRLARRMLTDSNETHLIGF
jgi:hypothetical protein